MANGDLDPLYKDRPVSLWVEDPITRDYLKEAWDDPKQVRLLVAGNSDAVRSLVNLARRDGYETVFGLCDRDFGATNYGTWSATTPVFRLSMHEIENALLSPSALSMAMQRLGKDIAGSVIEQKLQAEARNIAWGMALGSTLTWVHEAVQQEFPHANGLVNVADQLSAEQRILTSRWWLTHFPSLPAQITEPAIRQELRTRHDTYSRDVSNNAFLTTFAGKELLGRTFGWLTNGCSVKPTQADLAKAVGLVQRNSCWLSAELVQLRSILVGAA